MITSWKYIIQIFIISAFIRILLIPAYFSTDYDVHRNWLRITYNKPIVQWYTDKLSIWTLDYPPIFAYFQYFLSLIGSKFCFDIVSKEFLECHTFSCIVFHRFTVIFSEIFYFAAILYCFKNKELSIKRIFIVFMQFGFVLLDDIHFQYNSIMQGVLIFSIQFMIEGKFLLSALTFSLLLNMKHIYLYAAPAFFLYILKVYIFKNQNSKKTILVNFIKVGVITIIPFIISFFPFIYYGGIDQINFIFSRLFPFQRGLIHDYWAPNFWALYYFLDRIIAKMFKTNVIIRDHYSTTLKILPDLTANQTLLIIIALSIPAYIMFIKKVNKKIYFPDTIILFGLLFFYFGYHVHQKAIAVYLNVGLLFIGQSYWQYILVNGINLLPLLIQPKQKFVKILMLIIYMAIWGTQQRHSLRCKLIIISGSIVVIFSEFIHPFLNTHQFLPLMINSVWSSIINMNLLISIYSRFMKYQKQAYIRNTVTQ